ncbi:MAG: nitrogenase reductase [Actinomycetota bacterium]
MPKVIVCGRGGSGKSTLVSLLAGELKGVAGCLVVDADESNLGLNLMLGLEPPELTVMEHLGGKPIVSGKWLARLRGEGDEELSLFEAGLHTGRLPAEYSAGNGSVRLARIGKIEHSMEGCACPMGAVARSFLNALSLDEGQWVLVDTEAGVEHFGRGLLEGADFVLVTVDPSHEAVILAEKTCRLAEEAEKPCGVVLSKVDARAERVLRERLAGRGISPLGAIHYSALIAEANLEGKPLEDASLQEELRRILVAIDSCLFHNGPRC